MTENLFSIIGNLSSLTSEFLYNRPNQTPCALQIYFGIIGTCSEFLMKTIILLLRALMHVDHGSRYSELQRETDLQTIKMTLGL